MRRALLLVLLCGDAGAGTLRRRVVADGPRQIVSRNFDLDDTLLHLPSRMWLRRDDGRERPVSTDEFTAIGASLGQPGPYARYRLDPDPRRGSFREFHDLASPRTFPRQFGRALRLGRLGPEFDLFIRTLSTREGARKASIITSRNNRLDRALKILQREGYRIYLPPRENQFTLDSSDPRRKVEKMRLLLDETQATPLPRDALALLDGDGAGRRPLHVWSYVDNDPRHINAAVAELGRELARWPDVKIKLRLTGADAHTVVLGRDGTTRPERPEEREEEEAILGRQQRLSQ